MEYKLIKKIRFGDKLINLFSKKDEKVKAYCGHCKRPIFNLNTRWSKKGLCIYCNEIIESIIKGCL